MSWQTVNEILGLASIDPAFCQELLQEPLQAIRSRGFNLSKEEKQIFSSIKAKDIQDFSQQLLERFKKA